MTAAEQPPLRSIPRTSKAKDGAGLWPQYGAHEVLAIGKTMAKFACGEIAEEVDKFPLFWLTLLGGKAYIHASGAPSAYGAIARL
jgi:hypothetical protein